MATTFFISCRFLFFFFFFFFFLYLSNTVHCQQVLRNFMQINLGGSSFGPESIAFDCNGEGPYVSVYDGRILKWQGSKLGWTEFSVTSPTRQKKVCDGSTDQKNEPVCGRPLGLKFHPETCDLYIADAYYGILVVGSNGGLARQLVDSVDGVPLRYTNALDIDAKTGVVYFTDSSIHFQRREYIFGFISGDRTGRLLKYDPKTKQASLFINGLAMPNGVALSQNGSFILVAESPNMRILKFPLSGSQVQGPEIFKQLVRYPDNIKRNTKGEFWVALNSARGKLTDESSSASDASVDWITKDPVAVKCSEDGVTMKVIDGEGGSELESVSEVEEFNGGLWIGSSVQPYVGYIRN